MENYEVMTPEKEAEIFGYITDMIQGKFDRAQFATAEQKLRENGYLEAAGYTYEEMWSLLEDCGLEMDAILDRVDDYGMGMQETTLCTLDIIIDGNLFTDNEEMMPEIPAPTAAPEPEATVTPAPTAAPEEEEAVTPAPTAAPEEEETVTPAPTAAPEEEETVTPAPTAAPEEEETVTPVPTAAPEEEEAETPAPTATPVPTTVPAADDSQNGGDNSGNVVDADGDVVRPDGDYVQGGNPAQDSTVDSELNEEDAVGGQDATPGEEVTETEDGDVTLSDTDKIVNDILGETGLAGDELVEIVEEEVPLVSDPGMATNAGSENGMKKGWMLWWFFLLLLLIAILVGRAAYKKLESKAENTEE